MGTCLVPTVTNLLHLYKQQASKPQLDPLPYCLSCPDVGSQKTWYAFISGLQICREVPYRSQRPREMLPLCANIKLDPVARTGYHNADLCYEDFWLKYYFGLLSNLISDKTRKSINPDIHDLHTVYIVLINIRSDIIVLIYTNFLSRWHNNILSLQIFHLMRIM